MKKKYFLVAILAIFVLSVFSSCSKDEGEDHMIDWPVAGGYLVDFSNSPAADTQKLLAGEWNTSEEYSKKGKEIEIAVKQITIGDGGKLDVVHTDGSISSSNITKREADGEQMTITTDCGTKIVVKKLLFNGDDYLGEATFGEATFGIELYENKQSVRYIVSLKDMSKDEYISFRSTLQTTHKSYYVRTRFEAFFKN